MTIIEPRSSLKLEQDSCDNCKYNLMVLNSSINLFPGSLICLNHSWDTGWAASPRNPHLAQILVKSHVLPDESLLDIACCPQRPDNTVIRCPCTPLIRRGLARRPVSITFELLGLRESSGGYYSRPPPVARVPRDAPVISYRSQAACPLVTGASGRHKNLRYRWWDFPTPSHRDLTVICSWTPGDARPIER